MVVDYSDLLAYNMEIATNLIKEPDAYLKSFDQAAIETLSIENPVFSDSVRKELHVRIRALTDRISLRGVTKDKLNVLIQVPGMVTRTSDFDPLPQLRRSGVQTNTLPLLSSQGAPMGY